MQWMNSWAVCASSTGKYEYYGLFSKHVIRHSLLLQSNSIKNISYFKVFSDNNKEFPIYYRSDIERIGHNRLEAIKIAMIFSAYFRS